MNYLQQYDTTNYDTTLNNMTSTALNMSNNLGALPQYQFSVNASDDARKRAENATYSAYLDKLQPQFNQQKNDLQTDLINQGLSAGNEAYQRAMTDLQTKQNEALQQAAYQSVLAGQTAYDNSLQNSINTAKFNNDTRQNYIDQIQSLLNGSTSGYNNQANIYALRSGVQNRIDQNNQQGWQNVTGLLQGMTKAIGGGKLGS
jgi:hypothetical protein